jgi:NADH:ubiquinone oxidoreductase subunit 5 (subunit L)/multisubunit Na+/H+ antiporter MnhA subunit
VAYAIYARVELTKIEAFVQSRPVLRTVHRILYNRYYIDNLYDWITKYVVLNGICWLAQAFDTYVIDGIVNGVASLITGLGSGMRRVETGKVQSYMIGFFGGVAVLAILAFVLINVVK